MRGEILTEAEIVDALRGEIELAGGQAAVAEAIGVSVAYVSAILNGKKSPSRKVANFLGHDPVRLYRPMTPARATGSGRA